MQASAHTHTPVARKQPTIKDTTHTELAKQTTLEQDSPWYNIRLVRYSMFLTPPPFSVF